MTTSPPSAIRTPALISIGFSAVICLCFSLQYFFPVLHDWGLIPRTPQGLIGILTAPFLHGGVEHLYSNIIPFLICVFLLFLHYRPIAWKTLGGVYLLTGWGVWIAARPSSHIGASGVVYGLVFFLFAMGVFKYKKDTLSLRIALFVALFYGSMIWGILPLVPHISWESHLFGAISGVGLAFLFRKQIPDRTVYVFPDAESDEEVWDFDKHFPPPDGFKSPK